MARAHAKIAQQQDQQCRAGCAVDVIVAVDRDSFAREHGVGQATGGCVHVAEKRRIGKKIAQGRTTVAFDIVRADPAREQELGDDRIIHSVATLA